MRTKRFPWLLVLALTVGACGKQADDHGSAAIRRSAPAPGNPAPQAVTQPPAARPAPDKATLANEDGSETVEETTGDSGSHNPLLAAVASTMAAATSAASAATAMTAPSPWQEGVNYTRVVPAQPTSVAPGQVEVLEFFWYGCPHCYAIDPQVEAWRKSKPAYVTFTRVPVMWSEGHRSTARLYYTLESLGKLDPLHADVFREIHVAGDPLVGSDPNDTATAERMQAAFVRKLGIPEDSFVKAYHSFAVETDLQRADQLELRYRIEGVPTFVVNGKYIADVRSAGGPEKLITLIGDLAAQEHQH